MSWAPLVAEAEAAGAFDDAATDDGEMVNVIVRDRHLGAPVALELGVVAAAGGVDFILVGVEQIGGRMGDDGLGDVEEGVGGKKVVVIEEGDVVAGGEIEGGVGGGGDVAVFLAYHVFDTRVLFRGGGETFGDVRLRRGVVGDAEFPVRVDLGANAVDELVEEVGGGVVGRDDDADLGAAGGDFFALGFEEVEETRREAVVMGPEIVGLLGAGDDGGHGRGPLTAADHFLGELAAGGRDGAEEAGPAFDGVAGGEDFAEEGGGDAEEFGLAENGDGAGVFVEFVDEKTLRAEEGARAVGVVDEDLEAGGAEGVGADIDEAVEGGLQRLGKLRVVAEDVFAFLAPDEAVFGDAADGGGEAGDGVLRGERPAGNAEFFVVGVDPVVGEVDEAGEVVFGEHLRLVDGDLGEDAFGFGAEGDGGLEVEMSIQVVEALGDERGAEERLWASGGELVAGGGDGGAEEFLPRVVGAEDLEGEGLGAEPRADVDAEAGFGGGRGVVEVRGEVGAVEALDAVENDAVEFGAQVEEFGSVLRMDPATDVGDFFGEVPSGGLIDEEEAGVVSLHERGRLEAPGPEADKRSFVAIAVEVVRCGEESRQEEYYAKKPGADGGWSGVVCRVRRPRWRAHPFVDKARERVI